MAETDGTGTDQDLQGRAPDSAPAPIAQRNSLPMRKASTMPDVSRYVPAGLPEGEWRGSASPAGSPEAGQAADRAEPTPADPRPAAAPVDEPTLNEPTLNGPTRDLSTPDRPTLDGPMQTASIPAVPVAAAGAPAVPTPAAAPDDAGPTPDAATTAPGPVAPEEAGAPDDGPAGPVRSAEAEPPTAALPVAGGAPGATALTGGAAVGGAAGSGTSKHLDPDGGPAERREPVNEPDSDTGALLLRPSEQEVRRRALEREHAVAAKPALARFLQVVVAVIFPVVVLAGAVRAVTSSFFLWAEYHRPGFPADEFGFSTEDRLTYGSYAVDYVLNLAPARYLGGLVNPGGQQLFLDSEVSHMADVKAVLQLSFVAAFVLLVLGIGACVYLARRYKGGIRRALFSGAVLTLVLMAALAVTAVLAWEFFFTSVHAVFFADGTWTFRVDDTLIRLFPEQFWTDAAATVGFLVLAATLLTLALTWPTRRRRQKSQAAQDELQARHRAALSPT
ncbi:DUF1461 domain-containing protein [Arthrobacter sp. TMN-37]